MVEKKGSQLKKGSDFEPLLFHDFVRDVARRTGMTIKDSDLFVRSVFDAIKQSMYEGKEVIIPMFGKFKLGVTGGRVTQLPQLEKLYIPEFVYPKFHYSQSVKDSMKLSKLPSERKKDLEEDEDDR